MPVTDPKDDLRRYLQRGREALLWKLDGLSEYDVRRPLVPTGTNLLGSSSTWPASSPATSADVRPAVPRALPWVDEGAETNAEMWATPRRPGRTSSGFTGGCAEHSDATVDALAARRLGRVPWWPPETAGTPCTGSSCT